MRWALVAENDKLDGCHYLMFNCALFCVANWGLLLYVGECYMPVEGTCVCFSGVSCVVLVMSRKP